MYATAVRWHEMGTVLGWTEMSTDVIPTSWKGLTEPASRVRFSSTFNWVWIKLKYIMKQIRTREKKVKKNCIKLIISVFFALNLALKLRYILTNNVIFSLRIFLSVKINNSELNAQSSKWYVNQCWLWRFLDLVYQYVCVEIWTHDLNHSVQMLIMHETRF